MFVIYQAIILLQLYNIQTSGIRHIFCLISIAGIVVESQTVHLIFKLYCYLLKGQSPKVKVAICNVAIDVVSTCNTLHCPANINGPVIVKLKRELEYRAHVCEGPVPVPFSQAL